jgi:phospholipid/cholesterol/gamma-HCH transport system substrate-binding protein
MIARNLVWRLIVISSCVVLPVSGCTYQGLNSLPLPGAVGRGSDAVIYHVEIANVATLEPNSPVMINDVVVGSVSKMAVKDWHANVEVSVRPGVTVPANAVASVGQTSLLGSMHLALDPPVGEQPQGRLEPGATIGLNKSSTYPSTEQTLSALSAVVNGGGLGQIGDVIHNFNVALNGRGPEVRQLLTRLDNFVGVLDAQRDNITALIDSLNRLAATFAGQRDVVDHALKKIPPALDVLIKERPRITTALEKLGTFSAMANRLVNDSQADLVKNLQNVGPTLQALADIGPDLDLALSTITAFPYSQSFVDRAIKGDYANFYAIVDITIPRLKSGLFLGTRWGQEGAKLVPAPGDPWYLNYSYDPLNVGVSPPPADALAPPPAGAPPGPAGAAPMQSATGSPVAVPPGSGALPPIWLGPPALGMPPPTNIDTPEAQLAPVDQGGR